MQKINCRNKHLTSICAALRRVNIFLFLWMLFFSHVKDNSINALGIEHHRPETANHFMTAAQAQCSFMLQANKQRLIWMICAAAAGSQEDAIMSNDMRESKCEMKMHALCANDAGIFCVAWQHRRFLPFVSPVPIECAFSVCCRSTALHYTHTIADTT